MLHKEFWGILFLVLVGWIFLPGHPNDRIDHACRPIGWTGNVVTSVSSLVLPNHQQTVQGWFDKFEYGCEYTIWRLIYQDDYNKEQAALRAAEEAKKAKPGIQKDAEKEAAKADAPKQVAPKQEQGKVPAPPTREASK